MAAAKEARENRDEKGRYWYVADRRLNLQMVRSAAEDIFDQRGGCRAGGPGEIIKFEWGVLSTEDARIVKWLEAHKNFSDVNWREPVGYPARSFRAADSNTVAIIKRLEEEGVAKKSWHTRIDRIRRAYDASESLRE